MTECGPIVSAAVEKMNKTLTLVCISDTHNKHRNLQLPPGDVLIHAGDFTALGSYKEIANFFQWFSEQPHRYKVCVAGNHDLEFQNTPWVARILIPSNVIYLEDSGVEIEGFKFYGSPWTPDFFPHRWAFNQTRGSQRTKLRWSAIPDDTDVFICHGPPYGTLDEVCDDGKVLHKGCEDLTEALERIERPMTVVCGHIHEGYGEGKLGNKRIINAAQLDGCNILRNKPVCVTIGEG